MTPHDPSRASHQRAAAAIVMLVVAFAACSSDSSDESSSGSSSSSASAVESTHEPTASPETTEPPVRSGVDIGSVSVEPIAEGSGVAASSATVPRGRASGPLPLLSESYEETEYLLNGMADTYKGSVFETPEVDTTDNPYTTRILVRRPVDDADFSGRVFVEPFNTTGDQDFDALWSRLGTLLEEQGDIWIGVTVRSLGATRAEEFDAARYADLDLPTADYAWDILRQLGGLLKEGAEQSPLGDLEVDHVYMGGYSQSSVDTAGFISAFHADTRMEDGTPIYDGYLPFSHATFVRPLQFPEVLPPEFESGPMTPVDVPVIDLETQSDAEGFVVVIDGEVYYTTPGGATARRDDSDEPSDAFRLYEIAGASHVGAQDDCLGEGSTFPLGYLIRGAGALMFAWAEDGVAPPTADRIQMADEEVVPSAAEDEFGNALGGVRSPWVDVPLVDYDAHAEGAVTCGLVGNETPLPAEVLAAEYPDVDTYLAEFTRSLDETIDAGFIRAEERAEVLTDARARAEELLGGE